jgi:hypothetical protein
MTTYAGWALVVYISTGGTLASVTGSSSQLVDGIQSIAYNYNQNIEAVEATGQRTAFALVEGIISVTGTLERFYTGSGAFGWIGGTSTGSITERYIGIFPNGLSSGQPYEIINNVKFNTRSPVSRPGNALRTEPMDFIGISVTTGSI